MCVPLSRSKKGGWGIWAKPWPMWQCGGNVMKKAAEAASQTAIFFIGSPGVIRTPDLVINSHPLWPAELPGSRAGDTLPERAPPVKGGGRRQDGEFLSRVPVVGGSRLVPYPAALDFRAAMTYM